MKIALPDLISNSYFPAAAAVELGCFKAEGLEMELEMVYPVDATYERLRAGEIDFVAGSAHSALSAFPEWQGVRLLCAQGQGMYWFLVMRSDLVTTPGDLSVVKGKTIGAAPWVDMGLRAMLQEAGIDIEAEGVSIAPVPGAVGAGVNFGVTAAKALEDGKIDGFWANGMAAEIATLGGFGTVVADVRRGGGPPAAFNYTMACIATTKQLIDQSSEAAAAAIRAIGRVHTLLKEDVSRAEGVGMKLFPESEARLIANIVERDLPYYDLQISSEFVQGMNAFLRGEGKLQGSPSYEDVVAVQFRDLWGSQR